MGHMRHHALVVTSWKPEAIEAAHAAAVALAAGYSADAYNDLTPIVSPIVGSATNGYKSFMVAPDGSKEGWDASDLGNLIRDGMVDWLTDAYRRGLYTSWALVQFGDDDRNAHLVDASDWHPEDDE